MKSKKKIIISCSIVLFALPLRVNTDKSVCDMSFADCADGNF